MILFLDFDGVMHRNLSRPPEDFSCRSHLWQILRACPDVDVVFSTSWREIYTFEDLLEFVTHGGGEDLAHRFIGANPSIVREQGANIAGQVYQREDECRLWLVGNDQQHRLWLALDDSDFLFSGGSDNPRVFLVDGATGFTAEYATELVRRLEIMRLFAR